MKKMIIYFTLVLAILIFGLPLDSFSQWQFVGDRKFSSGKCINENMKFTVDNGTPYVIYSDLTNNYNLVVESFDGISWKTVGALPAIRIQHGAISVDNGIIYIAFRDIDLSGKCSVMEFDGTTWSYVGSPGISADLAKFISINTHNGTPYVAYQDNSQSKESTVLKYDGTNWGVVGIPGCTTGYSGGQSVYNELEFENGTPYLISRGVQSVGAYSTLIMEFDGTNWLPLQAVPHIERFANTPSLAFYNGEPFIAQMDSSSNKAKVMQLSGSTWNTVGLPGFSSGSAFNPQLAIHNGVPYVAYRDIPESQKLTVMFYDGTNWVPLGSSAGISPSPMFAADIKIDNDFVYVAYIDTSYSAGIGAVTMMSYQLPITTSIINTEQVPSMIQIRPNPASTFITVESDAPIQAISLLSIGGKRIKDINVDRHQIDIEHLPAGVYLLQLKSDKRVTYEKFVKQAE